MPIDHVNALPPGTRFEEYRLDAALGAGGFGITYRAYDTNLDKFVAIKEYLPVEFATRTPASTVVPHSDADAQDYHWGLTRFLDEARTLARFDHPHLNKVHRFFESNGTAYMVLEYIQGETLADRLTRERQLPEESLQRLLEEVLSGLEVMHDAGYVHRDIKPGNLMLREEGGSAVVLDFGAARQAVGQRSRAITSILTPGYAPIEQYDSKTDDVGPWSDIYALGMVAYRCISGISDSELPDAVTRGRTQRKGGVDLTSAKEAGKGKYNAGLLEAIDWAIEVDEEDRPLTVDAWRHAVVGHGRRKSQAKSMRRSVTKPAKGATAKRTGMNWSGVAAVVILVLVGVSAWVASLLHPGWFKLDSDDTLPVAQQELPADMPGEIPQEADPGETGEAPAGAEKSQIPEDTSQTAPAKTAAESYETVVEQSELAPGNALPAGQDEVTRLLAAAEANLEAGRLTSPEWNNAWDNYQKVLELVPAHSDAIDGMERVLESYMELFGTAVEQEEFDKATNYLSKIRELYPDSPVLEEGEHRLAAARQARADRLAEIERQRQAELERQRITRAIEGHWQVFEAAVEEENLSEATTILNQVRTLNPEAPELAQGEQRLEALRAELERQRADTIQVYWSAFEVAIKAEDLDEAANILFGIRDLDPEDQGLTAGEQRLESVRRVLLERQRRESEARARKAVGEIISIPGGTFRMGNLSGDGYWRSKPVHGVTVATFRMSKYEVTFEQWDACVADGGCGGYMPDDMGWGRGNLPVINVSWDDVQLFIDWLNDRTSGNYRLPTEAEWEYAARAGSTTDYSWGNSIGSNRANCENCGSRWDGGFYDGGRTAPVGSFSANSWGLHDMHGNVNEWVQDCWNKTYKGSVPTDGSAWMSGDCNVRMYRGGSWASWALDLRSDRRFGSHRSSRRSGIGFRLVQDK